MSHNLLLIQSLEGVLLLVYVRAAPQNPGYTPGCACGHYLVCPVGITWCADLPDLIPHQDVHPEIPPPFRTQVLRSKHPGVCRMYLVPKNNDELHGK